jgi:hypothetical protein
VRKNVDSWFIKQTKVVSVSVTSVQAVLQKKAVVLLLFYRRKPWFSCCKRKKDEKIA